MNSAKRTIRIWPTLLNEWRTVRLGLYNAGPERLEESITGEFKMNAAVSRGWAYHKLLEDGPDKYAAKAPDILHGANPVFTVHEPRMNTAWTFSWEAVQPVYRLHEQYTGMAHEVWANMDLDLGKYRVRSNMRLDGLDGLEVNEFKTTGRSLKWVDYYGSLQWRMNLMAHPELQRVVYHIFKLDDKNSRCDYQRFVYERYIGLERDVLNEMAGFIDWVDQRPDLLQHLLITDL